MKARKVMLQLELTTNLRKKNLVNLEDLNAALGDLVDPFAEETLVVDQASFSVAQAVKKGR